MLKPIAFLAVLSVLQSCEGANLNGRIPVSITKNKIAPAPETSSGTGSGSQEVGTVPTTPGGSGTPPTQDSIQPNDGTLSGTDSTILQPSPAVHPTVIAGATLTCLPNSAHSQLRCETRSKGVLTDFTVKNFYIVLTEASTWTEMKYQRAGTGLYDLVLPPSSPATYMVTMGVTDSPSYVFAKVGSGELPYPNLVTNSGFENFGERAGLWSAPETNLLGWTVSASSKNACKASDLYFLLKINGTAATGEYTSYGNNWTDLRAPCAPNDAGTGSLRLSQALPTKANHFYEISVKARYIAAPSAVAILLDGNLTFSYAMTQQWGSMFPLVHNASKDGVTLGLEEVLSTATSGSHIDDVRFIDLGSPP